MLDTYFRDVSRYPLLTQEEERKLAIRCKAGDPQARNQLVQSNLRLVTKIAKDYTGRGLDLQDLIGEGNLGLFHALTKFDPNRQPYIKFATYAAWWIRRYCQDAINSQRFEITLPVAAQRLLQRVLRAKSQLGITDLDQILDHLHIRGRTRESAKAAIKTYAAMPMNGRLGGPLETLDLPSHHAIGKEMEATDQVRRLLGCLLSQERQVLTLRFGLDGTPRTYAEVGRVMGRTRERIRQLEKQALAKISLLEGNTNA